MHAQNTIIGSSGRKNCGLIIFLQLYGSKGELFESNFYWVGQYGKGKKIQKNDENC